MGNNLRRPCAWFRGRICGEKNFTDKKRTSPSWTSTILLRPSDNKNCAVLKWRRLRAMQNFQTPSAKDWSYSLPVISLRQAILVCTSFSITATSSLLLYLLYKRVNRRRDSHERLDVTPTQGSFWLINLFLAGLTSHSQKLIGRFCTISRGYSCRGYRESQFAYDRAGLYTSRISNKFRWRGLGHMVLCHCLTYVYFACWRA